MIRLEYCSVARDFVLCIDISIVVNIFNLRPAQILTLLRSWLLALLAQRNFTKVKRLQSNFEYIREELIVRFMMELCSLQ
jgi:hypothetical protein